MLETGLAALGGRTKSAQAIQGRPAARVLCNPPADQTPMSELAQWRRRPRRRVRSFEFLLKWHREIQGPRAQAALWAVFALPLQQAIYIGTGA